MASKVLGDDFTGSTDLAASPVALVTGLTAPAWQALVNTTATSGLFTRTGLGATLVFPSSSTTVTRRLRLAPSGLELALGSGITTIEVEAYGGLDIWLVLGSGTLIRLGYDGFGGSSATQARYFVDGPVTVDAQFAATLTYAATSVWRIEITTTAIRFYRNNTLIQSIAASVSAGDMITRIDLNYFAVTDLNPPFSTTSLVLKYLHVKTETVSGALGAPSLGDVVAPAFPGAITVTATGTGSYTASWPAATDAVGVTGYEYSLNGAGFTSNGTALSKAFSGRPTGSSDTLAVRAFDAAGNRSTALSTTATIPTAVLIQDDFRSGALTQVRGSHWTGSAPGAWDAQEVGPPLGFSNANARRASGGLITDVKLGAWVVNIVAGVTGDVLIGTGVTVAQFTFYGNPSITISDGAANYLLYQPTGSTALVGTASNVVEVADTTALTTRSEVEFRFGPAGTTILKNGTSIYSDASPTGQIDAAFRIKRVELSWATLSSGGQLTAGAMNVRLLDWVFIELGRASSGSTAPPSTTPITNLQKTCVRLSKIYGSYTAGGVRTIIVPRGAQVAIKGENYEAGGPTVGLSTEVKHADGASDRRALPTPPEAGEAVLDIPPGVRGGIFSPNAPYSTEVETTPATYKLVSTVAETHPELVAEAKAVDTAAKAHADGALFWGSAPPADRFYRWVVTTDYADPLFLDPGYHEEFLAVPFGLSAVPAVRELRFAGYADVASALSGLAFSASDLGLPESDPLVSAVIRLSSTSNLQVCGGPADGEGVDRIVVLDVIPPDEITLRDITIYPDYETDKPPVDPDEPLGPPYSDFWTAFDNSYEAP